MNKKTEVIKMIEKDEEFLVFLGTINMIVLNRSLLKKNSEVSKCIKEVFDIEFPEYVVKSRTLMAARLSREIFNIDKYKISNYYIKIHEFLEKMSVGKNEKEQNSSNKKNKSKKLNANDKLDKWLKGIK